MEESDGGESGSKVPLCFGKGDNSIEVRYHEEFALHQDLLLLELPENLISEVLHQRVCLRGEADEDAVLCTRSKTYALKTVGTSNSVFLIPPSSTVGVAPALKLASHTLEVSHVAPRLDKLRNILRLRPYNPLMDTHQSDLYHWNDLVQLIQASEDELKAGLISLSAFEIDGRWGIVDSQYMDSMLSMFLSNSVLNDWTFNALLEEDVVSALIADGFPRSLVLHFLGVFAIKIDELNRLWRLNEKSVCVHLAHQVLRSGTMKHEVFMQEWLRKVPDGLNPSFEMLDGEVLTEKLGIDIRVRSFSVSHLPLNPADRFSILFKECAKWKWTDFKPYISDLCVPGLSSDALLIKYARKTQSSPDAEPIYSAR